jgi:outer membrane protein OmpA-like peptidoglycan-associated protein
VNVDIFASTGDDGDGRPRRRAFVPLPHDNSTAPAADTPPVDGQTLGAVRAQDLTPQRGKRPVKGLLAVGVLAGVVLAAGGAGVALLAGGSPEHVTAGDSAPTTPIDVPPVVDPAPQPTPTFTPSDPAGEVEPETLIRTVQQTIPVQFGDRSAVISSADRRAISELVDRLAPGERVAVSTYAGFNAGESWAPQIAAQRATAVTALLESLGVDDVIAIPEGKTPASVDAGARDALEAAGITHNRLAIISAVTLTDN